MKSIFILLATILILTTNIHSQTELVKKPDFRETTWGMSPQEVENVKTAQFNSEFGTLENILIYDATVGGLNAYIVYRFVKNKLVNASYVFKETHSNRTEFINDYYKLQKILIQKYGVPAEDDKLWYDDLYKDDPQNWGMAIAVGHLAYQSIWENIQTDILLMLRGDNYEIQLSITYESVELQYLIEEEKKAKNMDDF